MSIKDKYPFNHIKDKLDPPKTVYAGPDYFEKNAAGVYAGPEFFGIPVAPPVENNPATTYAGPEMNGGVAVGAYAPEPEPEKIFEEGSCPVCGAKNPEGAKFCSECGTVLEARS